MSVPYRVTGTPVDLKVERANQHRVELLAMLAAFRDREPYRIREDLKEWNGKPYRVITAHSPERPPEIVPLLTGDFINNLRSALDHLVGVMRSDGPTRTSAFPICDRRGKFLAQRRSKLAGIPHPAKELIERMQPYDRRYGRPRRERSRWDALAILETLWNTDKHRAILLTSTLVAPDYLGHNRTGEQSAGIGFRVAPAGHEAEWWLPVDDRDQRFDPHFGVQVALAKPGGFAADWPELFDWPLDGLVNHLYSKVAHDVLPMFREYL